MILAIAKNRLWSLRHDRAAFVLAFVLPIIFFSIFAAIFGGSSGRSTTSRVRVAVVDEDGSETSRRFVAALKAESALNVVATTGKESGEAAPFTSATAEEAVKAGDIPVALIVPNLDHLKPWAKERGLDTKDVPALVAAPEVKKFYKAEIERHSGELADFEKVRRFTLLPRDFSQERDELTPTLKIKRRVVAEHYAADIQAMYGGKGEA